MRLITIEVSSNSPVRWNVSFALANQLQPIIFARPYRIGVSYVKWAKKTLRLESIQERLSMTLVK
jgi:hypothetical protein